MSVIATARDYADRILLAVCFLLGGESEEERDR